MASTQQIVEVDQALHDLDAALDILTDTLRGVDGCEYPRLLAREIQALIIACIAHEKARQGTADERPVETPSRILESAPPAADKIRMMVRTLEAREAEISNLRDLLHQGVDTIEAHTLMDSDGTVVMHGEYQCISASEIEQWLDRAEAVLNPAKRGCPLPTELREERALIGGHDPDSHGHCRKCGVTVDNPNESCPAANL
jgi:hypothetical protein